MDFYIRVFKDVKQFIFNVYDWDFVLVVSFSVHEVGSFIHQVFADNEAAVADFKSGKRNAEQGLHRLPYESNQRPSQPTSCLKLLAQELAKLKNE